MQLQLHGKNLVQIVMVLHFFMLSETFKARLCLSFQISCCYRLLSTCVHNRVKEALVTFFTTASFCLICSC